MQKSVFKFCLAFAVFALILANKLKIDDNDCYWDIHFDYRGIQLGAAFLVPASTNSNIVKSEDSCSTNGIAIGSLNFYSIENEDEPMISTHIRGEFTNKGVNRGAEIDEILDHDGDRVLDGFLTDHYLSYKDLAQLLGKKIEVQFEEKLKQMNYGEL